MLLNRHLQAPSSNVAIAMIRHPPFITINEWYKPSKKHCLLLLYTALHFFGFKTSGLLPPGIEALSRTVLDTNLIGSAGVDFIEDLL